jgi:chorismate mutase
MPTRALRGAITCDANDREEILERTEHLLRELIGRNRVSEDDIASIFFTATADLNAVAPAVAARAFGLNDVPLLCAQEMQVPGSLARCIRVMLHFECERPRSELRHVFLRAAVSLRPDLAEPGDEG